MALVAFRNSTRVLRISLSRETLPQGRWPIKPRLLQLRRTAVAEARPQRQRAAGEHPPLFWRGTPNSAWMSTGRRSRCPRIRNAGRH